MSEKRKLGPIGQSIVGNFVTMILQHTYLSLIGGTAIGAIVAALAWTWWPLIVICGLSLGSVAFLAAAMFRDSIRSQSDANMVVAVQPQPTANVQYADVEAFYRTYDNHVLADIEALVRTQSDQYAPGDDRERFLVRFHSTVVLIALFEYIFILIFKSQILALHELNRGAIPIDDLHSFYDGAVVQNPAFYAGYSFNQWVSFMRSYALVTDVGPDLAISVRGREFLKYLVETGKSAEDKEN